MTSSSFGKEEGKHMVLGGYSVNRMSTFLEILEVTQSSFEYCLAFEKELFKFQYINQKLFKTSTPLSNSHIASVIYEKRTDKSKAHFQIDISKDMLTNTYDQGGELGYAREISKGLFLEFMIKKHVAGSYLSILQPNRFQINPFESRLSIQKQF